MCGIVAVYHAEGPPTERRVLLAMRDALVHRGPDDAGAYVDDGVALGHRRLSIIDLASGHQPMSDPSGSIWIVFNGEIYNYRDHRERLERGGHRFTTQSDTEVILALYLHAGERFVELLNGIFAFALWDARAQKLLLVRDRLGVKPLYLWRGAGLVAAASEVKALLEHPAVPREVDEERIPEYLAFRQLAGNRTLFKGITALGPGEMLVVERGGERRVRYWSLPRLEARGDGEPAGRDLERCVERLESLLSEAVRMQLMSDVPLGTFNSGGVDSSLVTSYVAEARRDPVNTFCAGLADGRMDERPYAEIVAGRYATRHHDLLVDGRSFADCLERVIWHHDEPLNHPNTVAMYLLAREAKRRVTVVLTGEGCDEVFAGYPRYRLGAGLGALGRWGGAVASGVAGLLPPGGGRWGKLRSALRLGPRRLVMEAARYVSDLELRPVLEGELRTVTPQREPPFPVNGDLVARMLEQDQRHYLLSVLNRLDKATMAFAVEARVPFLDHRLPELAAGLPSSLKLHRGRTKYLVKRLASRRLPPEIVYRRKSGLALPLADWFGDPEGLGRYLDLLLEPRALQRGYLDSGNLRRLVKARRAGVARQTDLLWGLVNLELWQRALVERPEAPPLARAAGA